MNTQKNHKHKYSNCETDSGENKHTHMKMNTQKQ